MQFQIDRTRLKSMARTLQACVAETPKQRFRYTQALDALARAFGYADWNTAEATLPETAAAPASATASATDSARPLSDDLYLVRTTHDYTAHNVVCAGFDRAVAEARNALDNALDTTEIVRRLQTDGWIAHADTTVEIERTEIAGRTMDDFHPDLSAINLLNQLRDLQRARPAETIGQSTADALQEPADALACALVASDPTRRWLLDAQLQRHPAPWKIVERLPRKPQLVDATGALVMLLPDNPSDDPAAIILIEAAYARADEQGCLTDTDAAALLQAYRRSGGTADELNALVKMTVPRATYGFSPEARNACAAAANELEIDGMLAAIEELVNQLGLEAACATLHDAAYRHRAGEDPIVEIMQPVAIPLAGKLIRQVEDDDALWQELMDLVDDGFAHMAAEAANAAEDEDQADHVREQVLSRTGEVNNAGIEGQVAFLCGFHGPAEARRIIAAKLDGRDPYVLQVPVRPAD